MVAMEEAKTEDVQSIKIFERIESGGGGDYRAFNPTGILRSGSAAVYG